MLGKQSITQVKQEEVDVLVTKYTCLNASALGSLGKHCEEISWTVQASHDAAPLDITVHVDKSIMLSPQVSVRCDDKILFPRDSRRQKMKLFQDFSYQWPLRGSIREGLDEADRFEVRPNHGREEWFPATLTKRRDDGLFEAEVTIPVSFNGSQKLTCPALNTIDIRDRMTKQPVQVTEQVLVLQVPKEDPLQAFLSVNGHESALSSFGRPTPKRGQTPNEISMKIKKNDRRFIEANVGHRVLSHFLSGEARRVVSDVQRHSHSWTVQLGPFAEHSIKVEHQAWPSRIVTLTVDDETFVDGSAFEYSCEDKLWEFKFRFSGEKAIKFTVFESNMGGVPLDTMGDVIKREKHAYKCSVILKDEFDFSKAQLFIDGKEFHDLHLKATAHKEDPLSLEVETLKDKYKVELPSKINWSAPYLSWAVVRAAAANAAYRGAVSAKSAAASGAAMVSEAAVDTVGLDFRCCAAKPDVATSATEVDDIAFVS
jgi:hypothetical protein